MVARTVGDLVRLQDSDSEKLVTDDRFKLYLMYNDNGNISDYELRKVLTDMIRDSHAVAKITDIASGIVVELKNGQQFTVSVF